MAVLRGAGEAGFPTLEKGTGLTTIELTELSQIAQRLYHKFPIDKGNGKQRWIEAPNVRLKSVQRSILTEVLYSVQPHEAAHGFVPGRSIVTNARPHVGQAWVANFDIKGFFPATKSKLVRRTLLKYTSLNRGERILLIKLLCRNGALPQGAPTSPHIANLAMYDVDLNIQDYADYHSLKYTRYADDLTLSGDVLPSNLRRFIGASVKQLGYTIAPGKSKRLGRAQRQMVTGLVVNERIGLPRPSRKKLRAILHDAKSNGAEALVKAGLLLSQVEGKIALQMMWDEEGGRQQLLELRDALA